MLLEGKKIIIMGVRNKWSIAWGAAQSAYENGAEIIFTYGTMENKEKIEKLISEIPGAKGYACDASNDESIKDCLENINISKEGRENEVIFIMRKRELKCQILYCFLSFEK